MKEKEMSDELPGDKEGPTRVRMSMVCPALPKKREGRLTEQ